MCWTLPNNWISCCFFPASLGENLVAKSVGNVRNGNHSEWLCILFIFTYRLIYCHVMIDSIYCKRLMLIYSFLQKKTKHIRLKCVKSEFGHHYMIKTDSLDSCCLNYMLKCWKWHVKMLLLLFFYLILKICTNSTGKYQKLVDKV